MSYPEKPLCHGEVNPVFKLKPFAWEVREPEGCYGVGARHCNYCGSLHPEDSLSLCILKGKGTKNSENAPDMRALLKSAIDCANLKPFRVTNLESPMGKKRIRYYEHGTEISAFNVDMLAVFDEPAILRKATPNGSAIVEGDEGIEGLIMPIRLDLPGALAELVKYRTKAMGEAIAI